MKRFFFFFAAALLTLCPAGAQVRFDADFESGSLGKVTLLDSAWVVVSPGDCIEPAGIELKDPETGEWLDPGVHGWVLYDTIDQPRTGRFRYTLKAVAPGDVADAILLIRTD